MSEQYPLMMTEAYWANSFLSVARHTGGVNFQGREYWVVNKYGQDVFELSARMKGDGKIIAPGEPCDLVLRSLIPSYKKLGRDRFMEAAKSGLSEAEMKRFAKWDCKDIEDFKRRVAEK